jgi:hypothetical protein
MLVPVTNGRKYLLLMRASCSQGSSEQALTTSGRPALAASGGQQVWMLRCRLSLSLG